MLTWIVWTRFVQELWRTTLTLAQPKTAKVNSPVFTNITSYDTVESVECMFKAKNQNRFCNAVTLSIPVCKDKVNKTHCHIWIREAFIKSPLTAFQLRMKDTFWRAVSIWLLMPKLWIVEKFACASFGQGEILSLTEKEPNSTLSIERPTESSVTIRAMVMLWSRVWNSSWISLIAAASRTFVSLKSRGTVFGKGVCSMQFHLRMSHWME